LKRLLSCVLAALALLLAQTSARASDQSVLDDLFTAQEWQAKGNLAAARRSLEQALHTDPANVFTALRLAQIDALLGDLDHALPQLESLLRQDPGNMLALRWKGHVLLAKGQADQAKDCYSRILTLDPDNGWAWLGIAASLLDQGTPEADREAAAALGKAQANAGEDADLRVALSDIFARLRLLANARLELERALNCNPRSANTLTLAGEAYLRLGLEGLALDSWRQALALDPAASRARADLLILLGIQAPKAQNAGDAELAARLRREMQTYDPGGGVVPAIH